MWDGRKARESGLYIRRSAFSRSISLSKISLYIEVHKAAERKRAREKLRELHIQSNQERAIVREELVELSALNSEVNKTESCFAAAMILLLIQHQYF